MLRSDGKHYEASELPTLLMGSKVPLCYVLNPKAACTMAKNFVFYLNHGYRYFDPIHIHYSTNALVQLHPKKIDPRQVDLFCRLSPRSFTIIREPLERLVSGFLSKVFSDQDPLYLQYRDDLTSSYGIDLSPEADVARSCVDFTKWLLTQRVSEVDPHFAPQSFNLRMGGKFEIDHIIRLDDRAGLVAFMSEWVGRENAAWFAGIKFNEGRSTHSKNEVVTDELRRLVSELYADDYRLLFPQGPAGR
jgi:hypothetical protein